MDIETKVLITNGSISAEDVMFLVKDGWYWVKEMDANLVHPYALPNDKMSMFVRYTGKNPSKDINVDVNVEVEGSIASIIEEAWSEKAEARKRLILKGM